MFNDDEYSDRTINELISVVDTGELLVCSLAISEVFDQGCMTNIIVIVNIIVMKNINKEIIFKSETIFFIENKII